MSGGITIEVTKQDVGSWVYYKHSNSNTNAGFTLGKITHSDQNMTGGTLTADMNTKIEQNGAIYVYYDNNGSDLHRPKVICISTGNPAENSNNTWYKAGNNERSWTFQPTGINNKKNPTSLNDTDLTQAGAKVINITQSSNYTIKLEKRPNGNPIRYRTKGTDVTVEKKLDSENNIPSGYIAYEHTPTGGNISTSNKIIFKHNGNKLKEVTEGQQVSKIFVYYSNSDTTFEFPLIVCVKMTGSKQKYYTRGQRWDDADLNRIDPDTANAGQADGQLAQKLNELKDKYEIDIGKTNPPNGSYPANAVGNQITVAKVVGPTNEVPDGYVRYKHSLSNGNTFKLGSVKHNEIPLEFKEPPTGTVEAVYVYYHKDNDSEHQFPLIVCVDTGDTNRKYYKRGNRWQEIPTFANLGPEDPAVDTQLDGQFSTIIQQYEVKLEKDNTSSGGKYFARPGNGEDDKITVTPLNPHATYKGFKHPIPKNKKINRITIHGQVTNGIGNSVLESFSFEANGGVYVYFAKDDDNLQRPYLICLSKKGEAHATENKWYKRANSNPNTWQVDNTFDNTHDPNDINTLKEKLNTIKSALDQNGDTGYTNPADGYDTLTNPDQSNATSVEIQINQTNEYNDSGSNNINVFLKNDKPKFGYTCYTHKVQGDAGKYKKIGTAHLKMEIMASLNKAVVKVVHVKLLQKVMSIMFTYIILEFVQSLYA